VQFRAAYLPFFLFAALLPDGRSSCAAEPSLNSTAPALRTPGPDMAASRPRNVGRGGDPLLLLPPLEDGGVSVRRPARQTVTSTDTDPLAQLRRWQGLSGGLQPHTWGFSSIDARFSLGLQSAVYYTDNVFFRTRGQDKGQMMLEVSPVIKVDLGDQAGWISSAGSQQSPYYSSLLYVPTFFQHLNDGVEDYAQHFLGEAGRVTEVSRMALRVDYDQRLLVSSENTSPEENFTMLDVSGLVEYKPTPLLLLRGKASYRHIKPEQGASGRGHWIGELMMTREISPKTKVGLGWELGHITFDSRALGSQDYQQALASFEWKPTPKLGLTMVNGLEFREFNAAAARDLMVSYVTNSALFWQATEKTRMNLRVRVNNDPSALLDGSLLRTVRFGPEFMHDLSANFYSTFESAVFRRAYDTGRRDWEPMLRLALGYRGDVDRQLNRTNIELFYQWHQRTRNDVQGANVTRNQVGVQLTCFF
jgi:hypothetical protein